jgi:hypothetical protein
MTRLLVPAILSAVVLSTSACGKGLKREDLLHLQAWLLCEDCRSGERQAVVALGKKAVPTLSKALRDGPSAARRDNVRRQLASDFALLSGTGVSATAYVDRHLMYYVDNYRSRAAASLGDIRIGGAVDTLSAVLAAHAAGTARLPRQVLLAVHAAYLADLPRFSGTLSDSGVGFLDTIRVVPGAARLPWDGDEQVSVPGTPFPDDLPLAPPALNPLGEWSITLIAVGRPGIYPLVIQRQGAGPASVTEVGSFNILSFRYPAHAPANAPPLSGGVFPKTRFLALGDSVSGDTVEYFRFQPVGLLPVTVTADWDTPTNLDLRWSSCLAPTIPLGPTDGATSSHQEKTVASIPGGNCWLLGVHLVGEPSPATAVIRLLVTSP